jgi:hypothetical protein
VARFAGLYGGVEIRDLLSEGRGITRPVQREKVDLGRVELAQALVQ